MKQLLTILTLLVNLTLVAQNYSASSGQICQAYNTKQWVFQDAPLVAAPVVISIQWLYCGPWGSSNSGTMYVDIYRNAGWTDLFTVSDSGHGCSWVTDTYSIPAAVWNEAVNANGGDVLLNAYISDSCPGGVGCSFYSDPCFNASVGFDYEPLESPVAAAESPQPVICQGESVTYSETAAGTSISYSWNFGSGAVPASSATGGPQEVYYTSPGTKTITLTVTNVLGSSSTSFDIQVDPSPTLTVSPDVSLCANDLPTTLEATGEGDFSWNLDLGTNPMVEVNPLETTTYEVTLTNEFNCESSAEVTVEVLVVPAAYAGEDAFLCGGGTAVLSASVEGNAEWTEFSGEGLQVTVSPAQTTTYHLVTTAANGCTNADEVTVYVLDLPTADAGADQDICIGESATLTATGGSVYYWNLNLSEEASILVSPLVDSSYVVEVLDEYGCNNFDTVWVYVHPLPELTLSEGTSLCYGESYTLTASGADSYSWNNDLSSEPSHVVTPTETTVYEVIGATDQGCTASASVSIGVFPDVELSILGLSSETYCQNDLNTYNLLGVPSGGVFNGFGISNNQFTPSTAGIGPLEVKYIYTDENGCVHGTAQIVFVEICENVSELDQSLDVYPNPTTGEIWVHFASPLNQEVSLHITDLSGKSLSNVRQVKKGEYAHLIDISTFSSGAYLLQVEAGNEKIVRRIVKR